MTHTPASRRLALSPRRAKLAVVALLVCALASGCVQRRFTIRSNPPGARVYVDNYEIGTTPCSHDFIYYGTREIRLVKDGYETLVVKTPFPTPWYQYPGIDFVSENLVPGEIRDYRALDFQLQPQVIVPTEQLMGRAEELRRSRNPLTGTPALPGVAVPPNAPLVLPPGNEGVLPPPTALPGAAPAMPPPVYQPSAVQPPMVQPGVGQPPAYQPSAVQPPVLPPNNGPARPYAPPNY